MSSAVQNELHEQVQTLCDGRDYQAAATLILKELGGDVLRTLHARFRDEQSTADVFSLFCENLWVALPSFQFRCPVRVWVLTLSRNAGHRYLEREQKRARLGVPLSEAPVLAQAEAIRTATLVHLRTESRDRVRALRASLDEADQLLLTLRIDRGLEFREIALVMLGDIEADPALVEREGARLRKRLQLVKKRLKELLSAI